MSFNFSFDYLSKYLPPILFVSLSLVSSCAEIIPNSQLSTSNKLKTLPPVIIWAWERPENLEFIDSNKYGVAFLAQTLTLQNDEVNHKPRYQPLKVNPATKLIAVTRIESSKITGKSASLSDSQKAQLVAFILKTSSMNNISAIQIDFDAAVSERDFYRALLTEVREKLPAQTPLSITALASFCLGDRWLQDLPVDEAIPMVFRMGADEQKIKGYLANGHDFTEPLCQNSYGIAVDEPLSLKFNKSRRIYVFDTRAWTGDDVDKIAALTSE